MAIFRTADINVYYVAPRLGYGYFSSKTTISQNVSSVELCQSDRINKYSRFRPGYWTQEGTLLTFVKPRGGGYADPRGYRYDKYGNPTTDRAVSAIGDFGGYNPDALTPGPEGNKETTINISSTQTGTVEIDSIFYLGEVDWFGEETTYHGRNWFGNTYDQLYAVLIDGSNKTIIGTVNRSEMTQQGRNLTALHLKYYLPIRTTATTYNLTVRFALGTNNKAEGYFPDSVGKTFTIKRSEEPTWLVQVLGGDYAALKDALVGLQPEDAASDTMIVTLYNNRGTFLGTNRNVNVSGIFFYVLFPNSGRRYEITQLRWYVSGDLEVFDRINNKVLSSSRFSVTMGFWGHGGEQEGYAFTLEIPETPRDNMIYRLNLDTFDPANCVENYD